MSERDLVIEHLNEFNTMINQLLSMDIKIIEEDKCINMLCSLLDPWYSLITPIGTNTTTLKIDDVVTSTILEETR